MIKSRANCPHPPKPLCASDGRNVHTDAILNAINDQGYTWEQSGLLFVTWATIAEEAPDVRSMVHDDALETKYSRPLDQVPLQALRKEAVDMLIGNLPFNHAEEAVFVLQKVASVKCLGTESVSGGAKIVWIARDDAERFVAYNRCTLLGDMEGLWVAQTPFAADVLASIEGEKGHCCPRFGVTVEASRRTKRRSRATAKLSLATKDSDSEGEAEVVAIRVDKTTVVLGVGHHIGGACFSLHPSGKALQ